MSSQKYDVVIVGSGMGGAAAALRLAQAGLEVLVIERGRQIAPPETSENNPFLYDRQSPSDDFKIIGGRSKYYGAALYRFRESDFEGRAHEAGDSPRWPVRYHDIEPYYAEAERLYRVHGAPDGDPTEPWRSAPYPHPPLPHDPVVARVAEKLEASGVPVAAIPRGLDYGPGGKCVLCAQCDGHYCRFDAKMDADTATLRPALQTGRVTLQHDTECLCVELDTEGRRATGLRVSRNGIEETIAAGQVILAAGLPHTPLILRRSRHPRHKEGIGNRSGWLGRGVGAHSTGQVFPLVRFTPMGPRHTKTFAINAWLDPQADDVPFPLGVVQIAGQTPFWTLAGKLKQPLIRAVAERSLLVFHMTEALPSRQSGWHFDGDAIGKYVPPHHQPEAYSLLRKRAVAAFRKAGYPVLTPSRDVAFWHEAGGAIMGEDPACSVTDPQGRVHGVDNLSIADASVLPSASAVNTGLTIVALALRTADAVAGRRVSGTDTAMQGTG